MREKLLNLMKSEQLTASKLAELLDIQPSGISHILGGRNKPSFDLVQKILRRFPQVNPDWLLLDKGEMYRDVNIPEPKNSSPEDEATINPFTTPNAGAQLSTSADESYATITQQMATAIAPKKGGVKRVIILFDDHTFESYEMQR